MVRDILLLHDEFKELEDGPRVMAGDPDIIEVVWVLKSSGDEFFKYSACYVRRFPFFKTKLRLMTFMKNGFPVVEVKNTKKNESK